MQRKANHPGIRVRHSRRRPFADSGRCKCKPTYEAWVLSLRDSGKIRKTFPSLAAAKAWRADASVALRKGTLRAPTRITLREAADSWIEGAKAGRIRNRSGDPYKPSALRGYEHALKTRVLPDLGGLRLSEVRRADLQDLADRLVGEGLDPSTIRNVLMPLRAIYRRALSRGEVVVNPTSGLELPAVRGRRDRIATPQEAAALVAALPKADRAVWATALYAGLRRGELQALRWDDVDLATGTIRVQRAWDDKEHAIIEVKTSAGRRSVPVAAVLRDYLDEHKIWSRRSKGLVFGASAERPFVPSTLGRRAKKAWKKTGLRPIGLHEARHTFASLMIEAMKADGSFNPKALCVYMGHASIETTYDLYGHLMPGNEDEAAALLDAYLLRANTAARIAQVSRSRAAYLRVMGDEPFTVCPYCRERIDPQEPGAVYAVEQIETVAFGPTRETLDGMGGYFHETCPPEAVDYARRPPPTAPR